MRLFVKPEKEITDTRLLHIGEFLLNWPKTYSSRWIHTCEQITLQTHAHWAPWVIFRHLHTRNNLFNNHTRLILILSINNRYCKEKRSFQFPFFLSLSFLLFTFDHVDCIHSIDDNEKRENQITIHFELWNNLSLSLSCQRLLTRRK